MARADEDQQLETDDFIDPNAGDDNDSQHDDAAGSEGGGAEGGDAGKGGGKNGGGKKGADDDVRQELRSIRARLSESEQAARYWYEQAKNGAGKKPAAEEDTNTGADEPLSVDLVDAISSGDKKAIRKAITELGFVDSVTLQRHVTAARAQGSQEQDIYRQYPDLRDNNTEMFKATQKHFNRLVGRGLDANSLATTETAAELAARDLEHENGRGDRVRRQAGDRGRAPARGRNDAGNDDDLSAEQLSIIRGFQSAGADVSEDAYRKRAQKGVRMSGVTTRR